MKDTLSKGVMRSGPWETEDNRIELPELSRLHVCVCVCVSEG